MINLKLLEKMYPDRKKRLRFISKCAFTFGLRVDALCELFGEEPDSFSKELINNDPAYGVSLSNLFLHGFVLQEEAKSNFLEYFDSLTKAYLSKNKEEIIRLLKVLEDTDAVVLQKTHTPGKVITEEEIITMVKYQTKYFLSSTSVCNIFGVNRATYGRRVLALEDKYPKLLSDYHYVADYYLNTIKGGR